MSVNLTQIKAKLATELSISKQQVDAFILLYDDGNTVPFIARYRKEATSGLDDNQLRLLETRLIYLRELAVRRVAILKALTEQDKLSSQLRKQIETCESKNELELLYLPFKSKRISKGTLALEAGIGPLADKLWYQADADKMILAGRYINRHKGFDDIKMVLDGALEILVERISHDSALLEKLRKYLLGNALLTSQVVKGAEQTGSKFKDYFDYSERLNKIASHRLLALLRGKSEGFLKLKLETDPKQDKANKQSYCEVLIANHLGFSLQSVPLDSWRALVIKKSWKSKLSGLLETQLISALKENAYDSAIEVFAGNLKDLLMAAPAGRKVVLGLDPGFRSGCKVAVVDETGKLLDYATIYPHAPVFKSAPSERLLLQLIEKYKVDLIAIGNGTASRETDSFVRETLSKQTAKVTQLIVSEAGASVYSASELASLEFPQLDVSIRGAVSIARRLQDPLAELVKIDAKAIGVGLYQHDLNQSLLSKRLQAVVEDCVNAVGVDLNSASVSLLSFIAGLNTTIAQNIVDYRDTYGVFRSRQTLKKVPRLGAKAFQQAAGFLRIIDGDHPLDNSSVHPEAYNLVNEIATQQNRGVKQLLNNVDILNKVDVERLVNHEFGAIAIHDIINEVGKPSRDPRPQFKTVSYAKGVNKLTDLKLDMVLQGVISNVTSFGAFVDIGVHQDGLVHISQLADKFVSDPLQVVKAGQIVEVKVLELDLNRKRVALTMRL
ncbi:Tex family protein [Psychromonas antarctica]|uniref:Tex family protein n=1 Tax=Psychromonas antarctica TaxID=67573 RepID=UPI001EE7AB96|nr:Tex family protein [Psychromonas antarctica]MCG6200881.1 RNA-binding transcriptional accessory protein [Psychromonas antarctica]